MTRPIPRKTDSSLMQASKAMKPSSERLTNKPISDFATLALSRYAAGLPLNIRQLEAVLGISRSAIYRLGSKGPPFLQTDRCGSRLYYPKSVEKWLAKNSHPKITTKKIEANQHGKR